MKVLVSSCLIGCNCKYNGKSNKNEEVIEYIRDKEKIIICPEILAEMKTPRPRAEIVNGCVMQEDGKNVDNEYRHAVYLAMEEIKNEKIDIAILQSRSPTCGVNEIYDGTFTGKLILGQGIFAKALLENGYKVVDVEDFNLIRHEN